MTEWMNLADIEQAINEHYKMRTAEIIRVLGRENYLANPVVIQEVGYIGDLWALYDAEIAKEDAA